MSDKKSHLALMKLIQSTKGENVDVLIDHIDDKSVDNICECIFNVIHTDLNLPKGKKTHLKKLIKNHCPIHHLNKITKKTVPVSNRRKHLKQIGRGLPMLFATVLPFIADLIFGKK